MFIRDHSRRRWRQTENTVQSTEAPRRSFPTNRIRDAVYTRRGPKWSVPAMLLVAPYIAAVKLLSGVLDRAAPPMGMGLHLVIMLCAWNALKALWFGPMSLLALSRF